MPRAGHPKRCRFGVLIVLNKSDLGWYEDAPSLLCPSEQENRKQITQEKYFLFTKKLKDILIIGDGNFKAEKALETKFDPFFPNLLPQPKFPLEFPPNWSSQMPIFFILSVPHKCIVVLSEM